MLFCKNLRSLWGLGRRGNQLICLIFFESIFLCAVCSVPLFLANLSCKMQLSKAFSDFSVIPPHLPQIFVEHLLYHVAIKTGVVLFLPVFQYKNSISWMKTWTKYRNEINDRQQQYSFVRRIVVIFILILFNY